MQANGRWFATAERVCAGLLFAWLLWLPLPFGSNVEIARRPLILVPLILCAAAACVRLVATRYRLNAPETTPAWRLWTLGPLLLVGIGLFQLIPLPSSILRLLSPASHAIWSDASTVASLAGIATSSLHPISVDPSGTAFEIFRLLALLATFQAAALLIRNHDRRIVLACVVSASALFQTIYGVRSATTGHYKIWGWVNNLIFDRVTGTFVNPNHFAHYIAIALPMTLFVAAAAWREAGPAQMPFKVRIVQLFERRLVPFAAAAIAATGCIAAILLSQSRGGLLALGGGLLVTSAILPGRRVARGALALLAGVAVIAALVLALGNQRTLRRFGEADDAQHTLGGRRIAITAAVATWRAFPVFGSGLGTFDRVVAMVQREDPKHTYHRAHNDYLEIAATAGTLGFTAALVALFGGYAALVRHTVGQASKSLKWKRRAFQVAALASLTIALVHALFDFNFFIPANPATLAVILGAAVTVTDHDQRSKGSRSQDDSATRR